MSESDDYTIRNLQGPDDPLVGALRQYRHNIGEGFVAGYDKEEVDQYVAALRATIAELEEELSGWVKSHDEVNARCIALSERYE